MRTSTEERKLQMDYIIETKDLTKRYGQHLAANAVSLHVKRGEIYGFIGRNGAGKTTCMKHSTRTPALRSRPMYLRPSPQLPTSS